MTQTLAEAIRAATKGDNATGVEWLTEVYLEGFVKDAALPYASVIDPLSANPALEGDGRTLATRQLAQVDLWQDVAAYDGDRPQALADHLDGMVARNVQGDRVAYRLRVLDVTRVPEDTPEPRLVHHALTVSAVRVR